MIVKKYKFKVGDDNSLKVPLTLDSNNVDQERLIEENFVKKELANAINPITDYDTLRYEPYGGVERVDYNISVMVDDNLKINTTLGDIGFTNDDVIQNKNAYKRSFINLMFFDSDIPTTQKLITYSTIFNKTSRFDFVNSNKEEDKTEEKVEEENSDAIFDFNFGNNELADDVIEGEIDETIGDTLLVGKKCSSDFVFTQQTEIYVDKLAYKFKRFADGNFGEKNCDFEYEKIGEKVSSYGLGMPYGLFDSFYLVDLNYSYNYKRYEVYVKWTTPIIYGGPTVTGVYFKAKSNGGGGSSGSSDIHDSITQGKLKDVNEIPLRFILENPITKPRGFSEGYYIYDDALPKSLYMRANYNNAKTGEMTELVTSRTPKKVSNIVEYLHTKYNLIIEDDKYYYQLDLTYSPNVKLLNSRISINLYEIQVL